MQGEDSAAAVEHLASRREIDLDILLEAVHELELMQPTLELHENWLAEEGGLREEALSFPADFVSKAISEARTRRLAQLRAERRGTEQAQGGLGANTTVGRPGLSGKSPLSTVGLTQ